MKKPFILGLSASLRSARSRGGLEKLIEEITNISNRDALDVFLREQADIHLAQFVASGRADKLPFDQLYRKLQGLGGLRGLSNSEVCLAAALWSAHDLDCEIAQVALSDHFPASGEPRNLDVLKSRLMEADGILLSTPVYFGDRSSISQRVIEFIRADDDLRQSALNKVYAGLAVGAKRNGGQETTLIYQMYDMLHSGFSCVGNDSDTTSQYGGTAHAGDIGTIAKDQYGLDTSAGTGRRIARVAHQLFAGAVESLSDKPKLDFWHLQDRDGMLGSTFSPFRNEISASADVNVIEVTDRNIRPCIACDVCPTHVGPDNEYRCIINRADDGVKNLHDMLLRPDIIVPTMYSPVDRSGLETIYQEFMERTRYLRRGDYVFTDRLVVPLVLSELGSRENLDLRMMTSFVRHHTVLAKPIVAWIQDGRILNPEDVTNGLRTAIDLGTRLTSGRLGMANTDETKIAYNPVGYILSVEKDKEPETIEARRLSVADRQRKLIGEGQERLETTEVKATTAHG